MLNDDFDPRAGESTVSKAGNDFGDFETAFGNDNSVSKSSNNDDGFADFTAAFSSDGPKNTQYSNLPNLVGMPNVLPNVIPPPNMSTPIPNLMSGITQPTVRNTLSSLNMNPPAQLEAQKSNCDLLGDLSDFGNLSVQPQAQNFGLPSNNNLLNANLMDSLSTGEFCIDFFTITIVLNKRGKLP